ncbi:ABC transporter substrate-binding protein [Lipingzhangella sp. LS1_29]|uniref:ABC transporter substrate-binding protein n=1 Tax=Lipingzhangella rawalii TaxID=2055835 RepID=A0ABU2H3G7_9ACTN|nr:ABC transporter substrate-binding protein [Lipingzhangella rawalii]MDS1269164.1 ABC transporter substrate-binding protein [Lipingzhangella rawalii]
MGDPGAEDGGLTPFLPPEATDVADEVTIVSNSLAEEDLNLEELAATTPDLILGVATENGTQAERVDELNEIAPTVLLEWSGTESWRDHLTEVAEVLDAHERAEQVTTDYRDAVDDAREAVRDTIGPAEDTQVSLVRLQSDSEIRFETPASFPGQIMADVGFDRPQSQLQDQAEGGTDFVSESYENLEDGDGDLVFVFASGGYTDAPEIFDDQMWAHLDAVADGRLYAVDFDHWGAASYPAAHRVLDDLTAAVSGELDPAV